MHECDSWIFHSYISLFLSLFLVCFTQYSISHVFNSINIFIHDHYLASLLEAWHGMHRQATTYKHLMDYENYDLSFPDQPVVDQYLPIWANLPAFRSKPAFIWVQDGSPISSLTYSQLNHSVTSISANLLLHLHRGDTVAILSSPGLELVETIFACQRAALLTVPVMPPDPSFTQKTSFAHLVRVLSETKPRAAVAHSGYVSAVKKYASCESSNKELVKLLQSVIWISIEDIKSDSLVQDQSSSTPRLYSGCRADEVYLIQYTSGATGKPKPVLVTAGSAAHNVRVARKAYDLHPNSIIASWLPQYHDCGLMFLLLTIVSGATSVLASPTTFAERPRLWLELITEFKASCSPVPSFALPLVLRRGGAAEGSSRINLESLKNLIIINEPIYKELVEEFVQVFEPFGLNPSSISPSYGLAENCTFVSTSWRSESKSAGLLNVPSHRKLVPVARLPVRGEEDEDMEIVVVNEDTNEAVEDGTEGEIWVSSASNASGYLGQPFLSCKIFQGRLSKRSSGCFVRTGDRGVVIGEERFLFVTGRCQDMIKLPSNQQILPHYMETAVYRSCPQILRGGCLAAFDISGTVAVVAELQRHEKDLKVLRRVCERIREAVLNEEKVQLGLVALVRSGSVPRTTSGKIQRWLAKEKFIEGEMNVVMEIRFDNNCKNLLSPGKVTGAFGRIGEARARNSEESDSSLSLAPSRPSLLSLL